jgi:hypothetical protein
MWHVHARHTVSESQLCVTTASRLLMNNEEKS